MTNANLILLTDSYKLTHHQMYPDDCEVVYSYLEARKGAAHPGTVFFGLQALLKKHFVGRVITQVDIEEAAALSEYHFGDSTLFNRAGWEYILTHHDGKLPIRIKAVPEGTYVPVGNVLMTVENTGGAPTRWLTNALESLLLHVWYPTTVATTSFFMRQALEKYHEQCGGSGFVDYQLHDFGFRGATGVEAASIGGLGHLISFMGTDTVSAILEGVKMYDARLPTTGYSVPATEHSVMTSEGELGELDLVRKLIKKYPKGILSVVADSYNIERFVTEYMDKLEFDIRNRKPNDIGVCKFVVRPDSLRYSGDTPEDQMVWITEELGYIYGYTRNEKGYKVLDPIVGVLWGDGITPAGICKICEAVIAAGWSIDHIVFGMGGGLLQKVDRDTERFAFKCSAQLRNGYWVHIKKNPMDPSKSSKGGRLKLVEELDITGVKHLRTNSDQHPLWYDFQNDILKTVFEDGTLVESITFNEVRQNAKTSKGNQA